MSDINALNTFPPSWWWGRPPADDSGQKRFSGQYPYAPPLAHGLDPKPDW